MMKTEKWSRTNYTPCLPLGDNSSRITGCKRHIELSKQAAGEGIVLLKNNDNILPLAPDTNLAVFGKAQIDYVKGGGGSGDVYCEYVRNIYESLKLTEKVRVFDKLSSYYEEYVQRMYQRGEENGMFDETDIPAELLSEAREFADTAVIVINRYSREEEDRYDDGNDVYFDLSEKEQAMVVAVTNTFEKVIVLINAGAMINTEWFADNEKIQAALMIWQGGMEGAQATADVLTGDITPSGKLVDTCAKSFDDYPSSDGFHESKDYVKYIEDIFVGYRYFETIPGKKDRVVYPFGYGLSYTSFEMSDIDVAETDMASYDDMGTVCESAYVLECGEYKLYIGDSLKDVVELTHKHTELETRVVKRLTKYCTPEKLGKRLVSSGEYVEVKDKKQERKTFGCDYVCNEIIPENESDIKKLIDVYNGKTSLDEFISQLSDDEMIDLLSAVPSRGVANTGGIGDFVKYGIPAPMTADGPAGVRIESKTGIRTTAFPVATMLACTWNTDLIEEIGQAGALEMKENNLYIWLTPALNIHRSPLCGRNFEYYSEDPYISGKMAAAMVRGIQSQGIVATPKHFACNNKETNRRNSDSILSERALREIYIKGFEICVKESKPKTIMTSYNIINGVRSSENAELITGILRGEWGYNGLVMTDWDNSASHYKETIAGNDVRMPYDTASDLSEGFYSGKIDRNQIAVSVKRVLELILSVE